MSNKKSIPFLVLDILSAYSSSESPLSASEVGRLLKSEYGERYDARTVRNALEGLAELGYPVRFDTVGKGKSNWFLERDLSREQTDMLLLSLYSSVYLDKENLSDLLYALSKHTVSRSAVLSTVKFDKRKFDINEQIKSINVIYKAIQDSYMLNFSLINHTIDGKRVYDICEGRVRQYLVKPISVISVFGNISLFGELGDTGAYRYFPIEKINDIRITDIRFIPIGGISAPIPNCRLEAEAIAFNQSERAVVRIADSLVGEFVDKFGGECHLLCSYSGMSELEVNCDLRLLKGLILSFGGLIEALSPTKLRRSIASELQSAISKYPEMRKYKGTL